MMTAARALAFYRKMAPWAASLADHEARQEGFGSAEEKAEWIARQRQAIEDTDLFLYLTN